MPPKVKFTREEVIASALELTREKGISALTARSLAEKLSSSVKPIFGLFVNMEELKSEVIKAADRLYHSYLAQDMKSDKYPKYKSSGISYIRFAKEQPELFKLLFMRDRSKEAVSRDFSDIGDIISLIMKNTGLSEDEANLFHLEMWIFVHGIATMTVTSYVELENELIEKIISDAYHGACLRFGVKEEQNDCH